MTYYVCKSCGHSTMDHDKLGKGPCLLRGCVCQTMQPGKVFVKKRTPYLSKKDSLELAAERGKAEE